MQIPQWLSPPRFEQESQTRLAKNLYNILVVLFVSQVFFIILAPFVFPDNATTSFTLIVIAMVYTLGCYFLMQRGRLRLASFLFCIFIGITTLGAALESRGLDSIAIQTFTVVILIAGLLLGSRYSIFFAVLGSLSIILIFFIQTSGVISIPQDELPIAMKIALPSFVFIMSAILIYQITQNLNIALQKTKQNEAALEAANAELKSIQTTLEERIENRTSLLQSSIEMGQTVSSILDTDELGTQVVQKFVSLFDFDFANLYFVDNTGRWANLRYSSLESQQSLKNESQHVDLTQANSISKAIHSRKTYVNTDPAQSSALRTDITIPLQASGRLVGALNLQAYDAMSLGTQELEILLNVANQIASSFENVRLFNETQQQFQEINRLNQFYLQTTWRALLTEDIPAYHVAMGEIYEMETPDYSALDFAQQERKIHFVKENGNTALIAPILFQDQVLGAIRLNTPDRTWTNDELILIEAVLNQTALSLENTRLITETQSRAEQERVIGEISSRIRETLDLETILQTTAQEMQKTFNLSEVEVRLLPPSHQNSAELSAPMTGE